MKKILYNIAPHGVVNVYESIKSTHTMYGGHPFGLLKNKTNGMLTIQNYETIYDRIKEYVHKGSVLEVGGAGGAISISVAWALQDVQNPSHAVVVEKFEGGSRDAYGSKESNQKEFLNNLNLFGVKDKIKLHNDWLTYENGAVVKAMYQNALGALILDADGRIDRDFTLFLDDLADESLIIIDDYLNSMDWKCRLTTKLLNYFIRLGLFEPTEIIGGTCYGFKPKNANAGLIDHDYCRAIVNTVWKDNNLPWDSPVRATSFTNV